MIASFENCVTFSLVFVTLVTMCQGQSSCQINSRPHPGGLCGSRLTTAYQNLCFLLSTRYPDLFSQKKRSEHPMSRLDRIYSIPLSVLAELDLKTANWAEYLSMYKKAYRQQEQTNNEYVPEQNAQSQLNQYDQEKDALPEFLLPKLNPTRQLFQMLSKRSTTTGGGVQKRNAFGMVCDCCMNVCTPPELATYC